MNLLFLTHRLPYALNRGDRIRAYYLLREMARFASVSLFSLVHDDEEAAAADRVSFAVDVRTARVTPWRNRLLGTARLPSRRPLTLSLLDAPDANAQIARLAVAHPPDVVVAFCSSMARFALAPPLAGRPLVLDMVDVDSEKWRHLSLRSSWPMRWIYRREADTLARFEAKATQQASTTLVVNARERDALVALAPGSAVEVIEGGIDLERYAPPGPPVEKPHVIFSGVMNYRPNEEAVQWFAKYVWPRVRLARSRARLSIVGAAPTRAVRQLADRDPTIEVVGPVDSIQPFLWRSAVSIAPLQVARGVQTKVLEALAAGLPVVVTPIVAEGLPHAARSGCLVAEDPTEFADTVLSLLQRPAGERRRLAGLADLTALTWSSRLRSLEEIIRRASNRP